MKHSQELWVSKMSGIQKLQSVLRTGRRQGRALFLPYVCVGYPDYRTSLATAEAALMAGASVLELGMPFSDPIADGPTLQMATHWALQKGTRFSDVFRLIKDLRRKGFRQPLLVMTYLNIVEQKTYQRFAAELASAEGDGAIVPDLPLEEFDELNEILKAKGLALIPFVAPTSSPQRVKIADSQGAPFLYYVSLTGVTGARKSLPAGLLGTLKNLRRKIQTPLVVGFGISNAAQAVQVGKTADGVIIASALIQLISRTRTSKVSKVVGAFCRQIVQSLSK